LAQNVVAKHEAFIIEDLKDTYFFWLEFRKLTYKEHNSIGVK